MCQTPPQKPGTAGDDNFHTFLHEEKRVYVGGKQVMTLPMLDPIRLAYLVTNQRRPILTLVEDTSPGIHDTLLAACDRYRYALLGCTTYHDNCTDNLAAALAALGLQAPETPSPWNLFMNIPVQADGSLTFEPPVCKPGDYVLLRAELDCVVAFSACPQDIVPINGVACTPTEAHLELV